MKKLLLFLALLALPLQVFAASISALVDNFNDNSIDAAKWATLTGAGSVAEANGEIEITCTASNNNNYLYSVNVYDLTGSAETIKVIDTGTISTGYNLYPLQIYLNATHKLSWEIYQDGKVYIEIYNGSASYPVNATYVAATYRYLKIREASGTIYFDYSADGTTWTNFYSVANPFAITSIQAQVQFGFTSSTTPTTAKVDDFNILPSANTGNFFLIFD